MTIFKKAIPYFDFLGIAIQNDSLQDVVDKIPITYISGIKVE